MPEVKAAEEPKPETPTCPGCGRVLGGAVAFCPFCGMRQPAPEVPKAHVPKALVPPPGPAAASETFEFSGEAGGSGQGGGVETPEPHDGPETFEFSGEAGGSGQGGGVETPEPHGGPETFEFSGEPGTSGSAGGGRRPRPEGKPVPHAAPRKAETFEFWEAGTPESAGRNAAPEARSWSGTWPGAPESGGAAIPEPSGPVPPPEAQGRMSAPEPRNTPPEAQSRISAPGGGASSGPGAGPEAAVSPEGPESEPGGRKRKSHFRGILAVVLCLLAVGAFVKWRQTPDDAAGRQLAQASDAYRGRHLREAEKLLDGLLQDDPENAGARELKEKIDAARRHHARMYAQAEREQRRGRPGRAEALLRAILRADVDDARARSLLRRLTARGNPASSEHGGRPAAGRTPGGTAPAGTASGGTASGGTPPTSGALTGEAPRSEAPRSEASQGGADAAKGTPADPAAATR